MVGRGTLTPAGLKNSFVTLPGKSGSNVNRREIMTEGKLKPGTIAHLKVTDEPVFILSVKPITEYHALAGTLSGVIAKVRRPNVDEHGRILHSIEEFLVDELETEEDAEVRKAAKLEQLKAQFKAERAAFEPGKLVGAN